MPTIEHNAMTFKTIPVPAEKGADRKFRFTLSDDKPDRDRDTIDQNGWDTRSYMESGGPVLIAHDSRRLPVAKTLEIGVVGGKLRATAQFPPRGISALADEVHDLLAEGFLTSASVGFIPERRVWNAERGGWDIKEATLVEWSIVSVPSNVRARVERCLGGACESLTMKNWLGGASSNLWAEDDPLLVRQAGSVPPVPLANESEFAYLERCMFAMADSTPNPVTRATVCLLRYRGGDRAERQLAFRSDEPVLLIDDSPQFEVDLDLLREQATKAALAGIAATVADEVRKEVLYHRGRLD